MTTRVISPCLPSPAAPRLSGSPGEKRYSWKEPAPATKTLMGRTFPSKERNVSTPRFLAEPTSSRETLPTSNPWLSSALFSTPRDTTARSVRSEATQNRVQTNFCLIR